MSFIKKQIKGTKPELPPISILSGVHGNECAPIATSFAIYDSLKEWIYDDDEEHERTINFYIGINEDGMRNNTRENTTDLNRIGKSLHPAEEILDIIEESSVVIDLHASPTCSFFALIDAETLYAKSLIEWCQKTGIPAVVRESSLNTIKSLTNKLEKIGLTIEMPGMYNTSANDDIVAVLVSLIVNAPLTYTTTKRKIKENVFYIKAKQDCLFIPTLPIDQYILGELEKGYRLGVVKYKNGKEKVITMPRNGMLVAYAPHTFVEKDGDIILYSTAKGC